MDRLTLDLIAPDQASAVSARKLDPYFIDIYKRHFINFDPRYQDMAEYGSMAVICPPQFTQIIQPSGFFTEPHLLIYPNPAPERTIFAYAVPQEGLTQLSVYNLRGQKIKTLVREIQDKGYYRVSWDLDLESGGQAASGIYFCRLITTSGQSKTIRFTVLR
ncbi:MAG: T9SS type A sorting domain-containing protein [Candidatus Syntrophosphaera sp.]|nr:T9SS type A sorting domain-containing protein [Candidatus Syntrophosphaera sp.]